ncbi:MAG: vWA domain-containing protein [Planctomycetota bacterium]
MHTLPQAFSITCLLVIAPTMFGAVETAFAQQNVVVVLDDSGSMDDRMKTESGRKRRIDVAKEALTKVLGQLPEDTRVGVLALNSRVNRSNWIVPFGAGDYQLWQQNIQNLRARGGTPLGEFLKKGTDKLLEARQTQVYGEYRLLVVTDGEANDRKLVEKYLPDIMTRGIFVDVIGVDMSTQHSLATRVHNYRSANNAQALAEALSEVFAETVATGQDADADFEILEGLPEGFAEAALQAMSDIGNNPIGTNSTSNNLPNTTFSNGNGTGNTFTSPSATAQDMGDSIASAAFGSIICCFGVFGFVIVLAVVMFAKMGSRKRR